MLDFLRRQLKPKYETLNLVQINADRLLANYNYLKSRRPEAAIFPVLKSNAYGHGLKEVCRILNRTDAPLIVVDSFPEAQIAYRYFKRKVLILGEMPLKAYRHCRLSRTEFAVYNEKTLRYLSRFGRRAKIHLFVNSGMNREGIQDLKSFIAANKKYLEKVEVAGLCSHLASADEDSILNRNQEEKFFADLDTLRAAGFFPRWVHLGNSAAVFNINNRALTAYRPGIAFYGYSPFKAAEENLPLQPALEVFSHIVSLQALKFGESVSYNETYRATKATKIAVIPFGYFEGLDRRLSNQAKFLVIGEEKEFWASIAGRVCMNLTCLEIGDNEAKVGDLVRIISSNPAEPNSILNLAELSGTISYEILVKIQGNIRREIV
ncbi:MAG: alanine racemase [Patescibacteria group bacterium]